MAADGWIVADGVLAHTPVDARLVLLNTLVSGLTDVHLDPDGRLAEALHTMHRAFTETASASLVTGAEAARRALELLFEQAALAATLNSGVACMNHSIEEALSMLWTERVIADDDADMLSRTVASVHAQLDALLAKPRADGTRHVEHMVIWICGYVGAQFAAV